MGWGAVQGPKEPRIGLSTLIRGLGLGLSRVVSLVTSRLSYHVRADLISQLGVPASHPASVVDITNG